MIVVDFDGVLFDAVGFKKIFFALLKKLSGVEPESSYEEAKRANGYYNFHRHMRLLATEGRISCGLLYKEVEGLVNREGSQYLFPEAMDFLTTLRLQGKGMFVLTTGTPWLQRLKIHSSGVGAMVNFLVTDKETKTAAFSKLVGPEAAVFLDDSPFPLDAVKETFPCVTGIQVRRDPKSALASKADFIVKDLMEALTLIF